MPLHLVPEYLSRAPRKANSEDPIAVARALEGMHYASPTGDTWLRADNLQLMMPLFGTVFTRAGQPSVEYDAVGTGLGWKTEQMLDTADNIPPVRCKVQSP